MPEQDPLAVALAPGLAAGDDLAELGVQRLARSADRPGRAGAARRRRRRARTGPSRRRRPCRRRRARRARARSSCRRGSAACTARATPCAGSARARSSRVASTTMSAPTTASSIVSTTRTGLPSARSSRRRTPRRDSARLLVTRISSKSKIASSIVTFENAVPRAPRCASTFDPGRPSSRAAERRQRPGPPLRDLGRVDDRDRAPPSADRRA